MKKVINLIVFCIFATSAQTQVASYNFFRDTVDVSGNGNDLTIHGDPRTEYDSCRRYMALSTAFMEDVDFLSNDNPSFNLTNAVTVTFWMRSGNVEVDQKIVGQAVFTGSPRGFVVGPENDAIKAEVFTGNFGTTMELNSSTINPDEWAHVAMVFDDINDDYKIYLNGVLDVTYAGTYSTWASPQSGDDLVIGAAPWDPTSLSYTGHLDDLQIYNTALSADAILDIYNNVGLCPISGDPIYVDSSATAGSNNGLTWANAFTDLQEAIDLSCNCPNADIWVAEGFYFPSLPFDSNQDDIIDERERTFYIDHNVKIYGGFEGNEIDVSQRSKIDHPTYLDGDHDGAGAVPDQSYHVTYIDADNAIEIIDTSTQIVDIIILGGSNDQNGVDAGGAGLYIRATESGSTASPIINGCTFTSNYSTTSGGGVYHTAQNGGKLSPTYINCDFDGNTGDFEGGAAYNHASGMSSVTDPTFVNCVFRANDAIEGIAVYSIANSNGATKPSFTNCTFSNHSNNGGVIHNSGSISTFSNCILWNDGNAEIVNDFNNGSSVVNYSIIQDGLPDQTTGSNNKTDDPLFISSTNLSLMSSSPAINAGVNDSLPTGTTTDLAGNPRILNGRVDMGAYEVAVCSQNDHIFVDIDLSSNGDGLSWPSAFTNLQDALTMSSVCDGVQSIWVAEGTYHPTQDNPASTDNTARDVTFFIDQPTKIFGGFPAGGGIMSDRDWDAHPTILTGAIPMTTDTAYHVLVMEANDITADWELDGFIVKHGRANGDLHFDQHGGGLYAHATDGSQSPQIRNCTFTDNTGFWGGGMAFKSVKAIGSSTTQPTISNCIFSNNVADGTLGQGGGIYARTMSTTGLSEANSIPQIFNSIFSNNTATGTNTAEGGGLYIYASSPGLANSSPKLANCTFYNNSTTHSQGTDKGGAIYLSTGGAVGGIRIKPSIANSIFWNNTASAGPSIWKTNSNQGFDDGSISHCLVSQDSIFGTIDFASSNIEMTDPLFVNVAIEDFSLQSTSMGINAGDNGSLPSSITTDIAGLDRINCATMDMGAHEFQVELEITCTQAISVDTDLNMCSTAKANITLVAPTANCSLASVSNNAPITFPKGPTTIKWFVVDTDGRKDTCEQLVTVVDNERPTITCPADITVNVDAGSCVATNVSLGTPSMNDNCVGSTISNNAPTNGIYNLDETIVRWIVTDAAGLKDTCFQKVTVVDNEKPEITCPADITITRVAGTCNLGVDIGMATATDNCTGTISITNDAPVDFPSGPTTVTWTATDAAMQMQTCTQIITVNEVTPSCPALGDSIFVDSSAMGSTTGLSWDDAFTNLQDAINLACDCAMGDTIPEIHVMEGTYYPCKEYDADGSGGSDPREATFQIDKNLKIYGGYYTSSNTVLRNWDDHPTILSGDIGVKDDVSDNSFHIMYINGGVVIDSTCILDGLTITDGNANGGAFHNVGGGIAMRPTNSSIVASPWIRNCNFLNNTTSSSGGAIYGVASGSIRKVSPIIENCKFENNTANRSGGALRFYGFSSGTCVPVIVNCEFHNNVSQEGGAIHLFGQRGVVKPLIVNTVFSNNQAPDGSAIWVESQAGFNIDATCAPLISNCTFVNNGEDAQEAAIHLNSSSFQNSGESTIDAQIHNSIFWNNGPEIIVDPIDPSDTESIADVTIINSLLEDATQDGNIDAIPGATFMGTNLDAYPMFVDSMNGDFRLMTGSPAIDAGDSSLVQNVYDITAYTPRIANQVDMGAYERFRCTEDLRFYLPGVFSQENEDLYTDGNIEISSGIKRQSDMFFSMKEGMTMLKEFEVEAGSELEVTLDGCLP